MKNNIASERKRAGLTQEQLARELGIAASTLREWELARRPPATDVTARMASIFGCTIDYLLALTEERT